MLGICAASRWELRPVLRALRAVRRIDLGQVRAWHAFHSDSPVVVFRTGIGPAAAAAAAQIVLEHCRLTALLNTGVAGGLTSAVKVGDLVLPDVMIGPEDHAPVRYATDTRWTDRLSAVAVEAGLRIHRGAVVTSATVLSTATEKQMAAGWSGAAAVEMEGSVLAASAEQHGIRFASVRSILDDAQTTIPTLTRSRRENTSTKPTTRSQHALGTVEKISSFLALALSFRDAMGALDRFFLAFARAQHE